MASEKQIAANRRNAQKSTGPRTQQGKARSSRNALCHNFSTSDWLDAPSIKSENLPAGLSADEIEQIRLFEKSIDVSSERAARIKKAEALMAGGDLQGVARHMKKAAALERYNRRIEARARRILRRKTTLILNED